MGQNSSPLVRIRNTATQRRQMGLAGGASADTKGLIPLSSIDTQARSLRSGRDLWVLTIFAEIIMESGVATPIMDNLKRGLAPHSSLERPQNGARAR